jgi:hypothetical protein
VPSVSTVDLGLALVLVAAGQLDLDQLVDVQSQAEFLHHGLGGALVAEQDDRAQIVGEAAQVTDLRGERAMRAGARFAVNEHQRVSCAQPPENIPQVMNDSGR